MFKCCENKKLNKFYLAYKILSPKSKKSFWFVLFLSLIGMCLEVVGIGMIFPAIETFTQPQWITNYPFLYNFSLEVGEMKFILICFLSLVGIFFIKNIFLAYLAYFHSKFSFAVQVETSVFLYKSYLSQPYEFFLSKNSSELLRNTIGEVNSFVGYVLQPMLIIITECLVLFAVISLLIYVEPIACLSVIFFVALVGWGFNKFTTARVAEWGNERQKHEAKKIQYLQEGFDGIKMIKLLDNPSELLKKFNFHTDCGAMAGKNQYAMQQMPRLLLEFLSILALSVLAFSLLSKDPIEGSSASKLGMIAFGLIRIMPSVARVVNSYQSLIYGLPCVQVLNDEFHNFKFSKKKDVQGNQEKFNQSFKINGVSYAYPESDRESLADMSLEVKKGTCVGILGKSGSGKSTLIDIALGLLKPLKGNLLVDGKIIGKEINPTSWKTMVGYVQQEIFLIDDSVRNNVAFGIEASLIDDNKVWQSLRDANLRNFIESLPEGLNTKLGEKGVRLSGGQRQRVGIARALYKDPSLVVFDEATSSLDTETEKSIMDTVYGLKKEKTFIIVAHRLSTIARCDKVYKIENGKVVAQGSFDEVNNISNL